MKDAELITLLGLCVGAGLVANWRRSMAVLRWLLLGGSLTFGAACLGATTYAHDSANRLSSITYDDGSMVRYGYDAAGNVLARTVDRAVVANGVVEFYNTILNHYFLTADQVEGASIDAGGSGPGWSRTGNVFKSGGSNAVCRFYGVVAAGGPNGHFYTADTAECAEVKLDPGWHFESLDFLITPSPSGGCPAGLLPVYRAYNNRFAQHDSNHRITSNFADYQRQLAAGWIGEGVVMCAQP